MGARNKEARRDSAVRALPHDGLAFTDFEELFTDGNPNLVTLISECFALLITGSHEHVEPFPRSEIGKVRLNQRFPNRHIGFFLKTPKTHAILPNTTCNRKKRGKGDEIL